VLVLALVVLGGASGGCRRTRQPAPPARPPLEVILQTQGSVFRGESGQPVAGGVLGMGEVLSTGADGKATVRLADGRQLELGPNGRLRLRRGADGRMTVQIESGQVTSRTAQDGPPPVELSILTPFGITRVPAERGELSVTVGPQPQDGRIAVVLGHVTFVDELGREIAVQADETIAVSLGKIELLRPAAAPAHQPQGQPVDVMLSADQGPLLVRRPGEPRLVPRRAVPAPAGTSFQVAAGGQARLVAVGLRGRLGASAAGRIGEASRDAGGLRLGLELQRGSALLAFDGGHEPDGDQLLLGDPAAPVLVRITQPTTVLVEAGKRGPRISVLAGAAELVHGDTTQRLDTTLAAELAGSRLRTLARPQADVILPTARGLRVFADGLDEVTLSWPATLEEATVEVGEDSELKEVVTAGRTATGWVTVPAPRHGDLHWRVTGKIGGTERVLVGQARFAPDRHRSVLDLERPHNLVTEAGPVTTVYFQSTLPALTFAFAGRPGAARYRLRLYRDEALDTPVVDKVVTDTRCAVDATPLREGRYLWHAVGIDEHGREFGGAGRMNKLELVYDNALTTLAIGSPKPGAPLTGKRVDATGVAPLGSRLFINGQPAPLDAKGRFAVSLERKGALVFRLIGPDGGERYWVRKLRGPS
jgi:hypothetical protein